MELDKIQATAKRIMRRLDCSYERAEYIASLLALKRTVSKDSYQLLAEIHAIHPASHRSAA